VTFSNFDEGVMYVDPRSGERREPRKDDAADAALLVDALDNIDSYAAAIRPTDVPAATAAVHGCEAALLSCGKTVGAEATSGWEVRACAELGACIVGSLDALRDDQVVTFGTCPVSPLKLPRDATEVIIECARLGLSDCILSMAMAGGSAPITLAGTLVMHNAEVLSGITLAQLTERGVPVTYGRRRPPWTCATPPPLWLAGARPDRRRSRPDVEAVPPAELHRRCVGRLQAR